MYIQPNTDIIILKNVPLNKSYEHTVRYANKDAQYSAFSAYKKFTLAEYSYQRSNIGTLRVELKYEQLYDCNYLMFKNTSFENKWLYAFITGCSYVSNDVSEIYYELDVMQTWAYDYSFMQTFVERQHATEDTVYSNTQPEGLELGSDYTYSNVHSIKMIPRDDNEKTFTILATTASNGQKPTARVTNGSLFSLWHNNVKGITNATKFIKEYIDNGYESNIVSIYTTPTASSEQIKFTRNKTIDGYTPRNNKLYGYPFCYLMEYNNLGESIDLKYENFYKANNTVINSLDDQIGFMSVSISAPIPTAKLIPFNYLKYFNGAPTNALNGVTYSQFPTGAFSGDSFKVWLAQNKNSYGASLNAIQNSYDTNVQIAQNNYSMAERSAMTGNANARATIATSLGNANAMNDTALTINDTNRNANRALGVGGTAIGTLSNALSGNIVGAINSAYSGLSSIAMNEINSNNNVQMLNQNLANANNSGATAVANAQRALSTAMQNASTSQASATLSALTSAQNATAQLVAKKQDAMHVPTNLHGAMMNDSWNGSVNNVGFDVWERTIKREYAEMIDQYFDKYGYAQRKMYTPTILNRPHWSYLQTVGCNLKGNLNQSDLIAIKGIYDNGITTWDTLEHVGNYSLSNK